MSPAKSASEKNSVHWAKLSLWSISTQWLRAIALFRLTYVHCQLWHYVHIQCQEVLLHMTASFFLDDDDGRHIPCLSGHLIHTSTERGEKNRTKYGGNVNDKKQMKDMGRGRYQQNYTPWRDPRRCFPIQNICPHLIKIYSNTTSFWLCKRLFFAFSTHWMILFIIFQMKGLHIWLRP